MIQRKFTKFLALSFIILLSISSSCPVSEYEDLEVEIFIEPQTGTLATEFHFSVSQGTDCLGQQIFWWIKDENQNQIDLGDNRHVQQFSRKFDAVGQYKVDCGMPTKPGCGDTKSFSIIDNGCYDYMEDELTWNTTEINLTPHRTYFGPDSDSVSYGFILPTIENICAKEHILVEIGYWLRETRVDEVNITADVTYAILHEIPFNNFQLVDDDIFHQSKSIGLAHIYGDEPGWFFVWFEIRFKNHGSDAANDEWLRTNFQWLVFHYNYWTYNSVSS